MDREGTTALLRRARAGSRQALDDLYRRYGGRLLALIRLRMGPELRRQLESRDVLQSCLLKSFRHIDRLEHDEAGSMMGWLARIAENEIRDRVRFHRRERRDARRDVPLDEAPADLQARMRSALSQAIFDERSLRLERALESLSEDHREIIVLRKLEERSWAEIAARLGRTEDACRMLLARAMTALTLRMDEP